MHNDITSIFKTTEEKSDRFLFLIEIMIEIAKEPRASKYFIMNMVHQKVFQNMKRLYFRYKKEHKFIAETDRNGNDLENVAELYKKFAA